MSRKKLSYVYNSDSNAIGLLILKGHGFYKVDIIGAKRMWRDKNCHVYNLFDKNGLINPSFPNEITICKKQYYKIGRYNAYFISMDGDIFSLFGNKLLKTSLTRTGYKIVNLSNNDRTGIKTESIHRLLAECFIPNPYKFSEVDHIDGNRSNNAIDNLRWCTHRQNMSFPIAKQRKREAALKCIKKSLETRLKNGNMQYKPVAECDLDGNVLRIWKSVREAGRMTGISFQCISRCCTGKSKQSHGRIWLFAESATVLQI